MRNEIVKHSRKEFARRREEVSGQESSGRYSSRKVAKTNGRTKKKPQITAELMIDEI